jgi:succinate dehydrogenase/fumarate reductase flavoprotein subunit
MMLRAGTVQGKLELGGTGTTMLDLFCAPGLEYLLGHGGRFLNARGEAYMQRPVEALGQRRSALGVESLREARAGQGPVYLDVTHLSEYERALARRVIPIVTGNLESVGFDISRHRFPYSSVWPGISGTSGCGAAIDERGKTSVPGLWAAGGCTDGAYLTMGQNLGTCAALGWWAGESAGREFADFHPLEAPPSQQDALIQRASAPLRRTGPSFDAAREALMQVPRQLSHVMHEQSLSEALGRLEAIRQELNEASARDEHELVKVLGLQNAATVMDLSLRAMLRRQESRGTVLRSDYAYTDNKRWLSWSRCRLNDRGALDWWEEPVPDSQDFESVPRVRVEHPFFAGGMEPSEQPA